MRVAAAILLFVSAPLFAADCLPQFDYFSASLIPARLGTDGPSTLQLRQYWPCTVTHFGTPTLLVDQQAITVRQAVAVSRAETGRGWHDESFAMPPATAPVWYGVSAVYDITFDDGQTASARVGRDVQVDGNPPSLIMAPLLPDSRTPITVEVHGTTANISSVASPPQISVDGHNVDIVLDIFMSALPMAWRYDEHAMIAPLPPGDYDVTWTVRIYFNTSTLPNDYERARMHFTVTPAPRRRAAGK